MPRVRVAARMDHALPRTARTAAAGAGYLGPYMERMQRMVDHRTGSPGRACWGRRPTTSYTEWSATWAVQLGETSRGSAARPRHQVRGSRGGSYRRSAKITQMSCTSWARRPWKSGCATSSTTRSGGGSWPRNCNRWPRHTARRQSSRRSPQRLSTCCPAECWVCFFHTGAAAKPQLLEDHAAAEL